MPLKFELNCIHEAQCATCGPACSVTAMGWLPYEYQRGVY
jgi:hypothetical protein